MKNGSGWAEQAGRSLGLNTRAPSVRWQQGTIHWRLAAQMSPGREGAGLVGEMAWESLFLRIQSPSRPWFPER